MRVIKDDLIYSSLNYSTVIPAGTEVVFASNLPQVKGNVKYWAESWPNMTEYQKSWQRNYGFLIWQHETTEV